MKRLFAIISLLLSVTLFALSKEKNGKEIIKEKDELIKILKQQLAECNGSKCDDPEAV